MVAEFNVFALAPVFLGTQTNVSIGQSPMRCVERPRTRKTLFTNRREAQIRRDPMRGNIVRNRMSACKKNELHLAIDSGHAGLLCTDWLSSLAEQPFQ